MVARIKHGRSRPLRAKMLLAALLGIYLQPALAEPLPDPNQVPATGASQTDWSAVKAEADAQTAAYNSMKAAAEARTAAIAAENAEANARFGNIKGQTTIAGTSTLNSTETTAARAEGLLLVSRAMTQAATILANNITATTPVALKDRPIVVVTAMTEVATTDAIQFDSQLPLFEATLTTRNAELEDAIRAAGGTSASGGDRMAGLPMAGALIDSLARLGSYFQTDYTFGGVTVSPPTTMTSAAVASALRASLAAAGRTQNVYLPANALAQDATAIMAQLRPVYDLYIRTAGNAAAAKQLAATIRSTNPSAATRLDAAEASATRAVGAFEAFVNGLTQSTGGAEPALARIARQRQIQTQLTRTPLILLVTTQNVAAFYTRKNLWTFLGGPPLYTMGGVSVAYTLFEPADGNVVAAGVIPVHGGYRSVNSVERLFGQ